MRHVNASLWSDMLEKVLIIGYSPSALFSLLTFYQKSYGIFLPLIRYHFAQLPHPVPDFIPTGHFPPVLDLYLCQCCSKYATVIASPFPSSCSPLHWNESQITDLLNWSDFPKHILLLTDKHMLRSVHSVLHSKCSYRRTMFFVNFVTGTN